MLGWLKNLFKKFGKKRIITCIIIGLDGAGKSSVLGALSNEKPGETTPTIGFSSEVIQRGKYQIKLFDLGGGATFRSIWDKYFAEVYGIIFVIDSTDQRKFEAVTEVFSSVIQDPALHNKPVLICANKQDLTGAVSVEDITARIQLDNYSQNIFSVIPTNSHQRPVDPQISSGVAWLLEQIDKDYSKLEQQVHKDVEARKKVELRDKEEKMKRLTVLREEMDLESSAKKAKRKHESEQHMAALLRSRHSPSSSSIPSSPLSSIDPLPPHHRSLLSSSSLSSLAPPNTILAELSDDLPHSMPSHDYGDNNNNNNNRRDKDVLPISPPLSPPSHLPPIGRNLVFNTHEPHLPKSSSQSFKNRHSNIPTISLPEDMPLGKLVKEKRKSEKRAKKEKNNNDKSTVVQVSPSINDEDGDDEYDDDGVTRRRSDFEPLELQEVSQKQFFLTTDWPLRKDVLPSIPSGLSKTGSSSSMSAASSFSSHHSLSFSLPPPRSSLSKIPPIPSHSPPHPNSLSQSISTSSAVWEKLVQIDENDSAIDIADNT